MVDPGKPTSTKVRENFSQILPAHCKKNYFDTIQNIEDEELKRK